MHANRLPGDQPALDWLPHTGLGGDFVRVGLTAGESGTLGTISDQVDYLSAESARSLAASLPGSPA